MKKRGCFFSILLSVLVVLSPMLLVAGIFGCISFSMCSHIEKAPSPGAPQITYAEFPFTLVYEQDGEEIVINDTLICEYKGIQWNDGQGKKFRKWDETYASGVDKLILGQRSTDEYDEYVVFTDGYYPARLMGDAEHYLYDRGSTVFGVTREKHYTGGTLSGGTSYSAISDGELYKNFGIRLISFEMHAEPIENSFAPADPGYE